MGLAQTARDKQRATIGGRANPFQNDDPLGKAFADSVEKGAGDAVKGVMDWWERSSADQEGISDDLLRLVAGGVKNTTKAWKDASAEQEGITDDILRGVGWTAGKGMQVLDAGSYYGGKLGGKLGEMAGIDPRLTGAAGNIIGDVLAGGAVAKAAKVGKATRALRVVGADNPIGVGEFLKPGPGATRGWSSQGYLKDLGTTIKAGDVKQTELIRELKQTNIRRFVGGAADDTRIAGLVDDTTRVERGKWTLEDIPRRQKINEAEFNAWRRTEHGKSPNTYDRIRRGHQGTPTKQTELRAKEWAKNHSDPRIRERLVKMDAYESRITPVNYEKNLYPEWITQANVKGGNRKIKQLEGLEYTVEQHHLIHLRDSATIGKYLDDLDSPITKAAVYEYMMKEYNILPGNFDLNIANIPTGPHRMKIGGDLHTWLDRLGYDDYWGDVAAEWTRLGKTPTATDILDSFDIYMDEVFHPMMVKLDDLVKKNPTKGEFKGAYTPEYLVEQAKERLRHLQEPQRPDRLRGSQAGAEEAIEAQSANEIIEISAKIHERSSLLPLQARTTRPGRDPEARELDQPR